MVNTTSLRLAGSIRYPITISNVYVAPNSKMTKGQTVFQYTSEYDYETGDPLKPETILVEKRKLISDYESLNDATIKTLNIAEGMVINANLVWARVEEECSHEVQFEGLCVECGKDMTGITYLSGIAESKRAQISMVHSNSGLKVSETFASSVQVERQRKLLKDRKLSLVVDLDMTILHAVCDPTVGEWKNDPNNVNYNALQDVKQFTLADTPHLWYYVKFRNGLDMFLERISKIYEMHIYTMGTRAYANEIAKLIDPDHKLFGDRIISRDENGSMHKKSLERLFPVSQRMVAIIDDRMDVWEFNLPHLVKVVPYDFFVGLGDIHASFLPKLDPVPAADPPKPSVDQLADRTKEVKDSAASTDEALPVDKEAAAPKPEANSKSAEGLEDEEATLKAQEEEEKQLEAQLLDRPLLQKQQKLDSEVDANPEADEAKSEEKSSAHIHGHALLRDDDTELWSLADNLTCVHKIFYSEYDDKVKSAEEVGQPGRVQQMKPGQKKRKPPGSHLTEVKNHHDLPIRTDHAGDLKVVPDVGQIMPRLKLQTLAGCKVVLSGLVPLGADLYKSMITRELQSFGAEVQGDVNTKTTHLVVSNTRARTQKVRRALKIPHIKVVSYGWLQQSYKEWKRANETDYLIENHSPALIDPNHAALDSDAEDDGGKNDSTAKQEGEEDADQTLPSSQESARTESDYDYEEDVDGLLPDEANSPVDDLKSFKWGECDDELNDFLGSDADDVDSDMDGSEAGGSDSMDFEYEPPRSNKRKSSDISYDAEDTDNGSEPEDMNLMSKVAKKQRRARGRSSRLKTVKNIEEDMESGLPTPEVTGGEEGDVEGGDDGGPATTQHSDNEGGEADGDTDLENMLENEMFAEMQNGEGADDDVG